MNSLYEEELVMVLVIELEVDMKGKCRPRGRCSIWMNLELTEVQVHHHLTTGLCEVLVPTTT